MRETGPVELLFMYYELMDPCVYGMIEHAEPLGSLGLNGVGDEPADEYIPTDVVVATKETTDNEESVDKETVEETVETESRIDVSAITNDDAVIRFKVLSNEEEHLVQKEKEEEKKGVETEKEKETEKEATDKGKRVEKIIDSKDTEPLSKQIPEDMMLPSVTEEEPIKIKLGRGIAFKEVNWYKASLPKIDPTDKGKEPLVEEIKGNPAKEMFTLIYQIRVIQIREIRSEVFVSDQITGVLNSSDQRVSDSVQRFGDQIRAYQFRGFVNRSDQIRTIQLTDSVQYRIYLGQRFILQIRSDQRFIRYRIERYFRSDLSMLFVIRFQIRRRFR
ncbi:hypothetical protein F511_30037 [Dorcoceras hygrometricum]|uniref:Uncharacterized protein n=1 Tax=Dorcoceras hygrometricum TaxID=472368 RepID=A0A2Z7CTK0_9LAMI|nr:hypothetical protein F511_30037 [Dorcoceras hygrometricum]